MTDITEPASQIAQVAAIVVGGTWAYAKYVRGRTFQPRAKLSVAAELLAFASDHALVAKVSMENQGLSRIRLPKDERILYVDALPAKRWAPGVNVSWDEETMQTPLFEDHEWVEPGEMIDDELLVPLQVDPSAPPVAYQVRAWVRTPRPLRRNGIAWSAKCALPIEMGLVTQRDAAAMLDTESG